MDFIADSHLIPVLQSGDLPVGSLSAVERYLLDNVDGKRTVEQLGELCGLEVEITGKMVGKLLKAGVLHVSEHKVEKVKPETERANDETAGKSADSRESVENEPVEPAAGEVAISEFFSTLESANYYELLGVAPNAQRSDIRAAYFALSKKFHPDTHFLNNDTALKTKLSRIFDKVTVAYETLSGKSKRKQYDATIAAEIELWNLGHSLKQSVQAAAKDAENRVGAETPSTTSDSATEAKESGRKARPSISQRISAMPGSRTSYRRTPVQDEVVVNIGARISRMPVTRVSRTAEDNSSAATGSTANDGDAHPDTTPMSDSSADRETDSLSSQQREQRRDQWRRDRLKKAIGGGPPVTSLRGRTTNRMDSVSEAGLFDQARLAIEQQHFDHAIQYIQELLRRDGENALAAQLLRAAQNGKLKFDANELIRQGRYEQSQGNMQTALELYERAYKLDIRNDEAKYHIAALLLEVRKDLRRAVQLCREIVGMGARKPQYYITLADLYELANERGRAIQTIQRAVELNPGDSELRRRLKSMSRK